MAIKIPIISDNMEIKKLIEKKRAEDIVFYISNNYKKISKKNLLLLVNTLMDLKDEYYIFNALILIGLNEPSISDILVKGLINQKNNYYIKRAALKDDISNDNRRLLIDALIENKSEHLYETFLSSNCPSDKKKEIINKIIEIEDNDQIYELMGKEGIDIDLEKKFIDILIRNEKYEYIKRLYNNLHEETRKEAFKAIESSNNAEAIYEFAFSIDITEEQKQRLMNSLAQTKNAKYIYKFIKDVIKDGYIESKYELLLEEAILKSKDLIYIANYIYLKRDKLLLEEIFGDFYKFTDYCYLNERDLNFNLRNLNAWIGEESYRYVDNNIDNYLSRNCFKISKGGK